MTPPQTESRFEPILMKKAPPENSIFRTPDGAFRVSELRAAIRGFMQGKLIYNRIIEMWRGQDETVQLKISTPNGPAPVLSGALRGTPVSALVPLTGVMSAEPVGGAGIKVRPTGPIKKRISDLNPTTWQWTVTPLAEGAFRLLSLIVYVHMQDGSQFTLKTYEDTIVVRVTATERLNDIVSDISPLWGFAAGAVPVGWAAYVFLMRGGWRKPSPKRKRHVPLSQKLRSRLQRKRLQSN